MTRMAVITKSFAPDFGLCTALNRSMPENSPDTILHHIIVPESDLTLFGRLAGPRTHIRCEADFLPRTFVRLPRLPQSSIMVNVAWPFPPVRGWIQQQVIEHSGDPDQPFQAIPITHSDRSRSLIPIDPDQCGAVSERAPLDAFPDLSVAFRASPRSQ
jgi:hypothetical protein